MQTEEAIREEYEKKRRIYAYNVGFVLGLFLMDALVLLILSGIK